MISCAMAFFLISIIAAVLGFTGIAVGSAAIVAKIMFFIFLALTFVALVAASLRCSFGLAEQTNETGDFPAMTSDQEIEREIQAKGLTAPRVTPQDTEIVIVNEQYHVFEGSCLTVCCLTLRNGFTVTGESACASPANFNAELGRKIAREKAREKIWPLEGYLLRQRLFEADLQRARAKV